MTKEKVSGASARDGSIEAVDRAARVLDALAARTTPATLAEVAMGAELSKPTAFRILATLMEAGMAAQNSATGAYRLGPAPLRLAAQVLRGVAVRPAALPAMGRVRDDVNETVVLSIRDGDYRYNIDSAAADNAIAQAQRIGVGIPLYAGAASRALLAGMDAGDLLSYLDRTPLQRFSEATIVDRDALVAEIDKARALGYAMSSGEFTSAGHAVAMAVRDARGSPVAALHVSVPSSRFSPAVRERCVASLRSAIAEIEAETANRG